jgi:hypothetical protein
MPALSETSRLVGLRFPAQLVQHGHAAHPQARVAQPRIHLALSVGLPGARAQHDVAHHTAQPIDRVPPRLALHQLQQAGQAGLLQLPMVFGQ